MDSTIKFDGLAKSFEDGRPEYPDYINRKSYILTMVLNQHR